MCSARECETGATTPRRGSPVWSFQFLRHRLLACALAATRSHASVSCFLHSKPQMSYYCPLDCTGPGNKFKIKSSQKPYYFWVGAEKEGDCLVTRNYMSLGTSKSAATTIQASGIGGVGPDKGNWNQLGPPARSKSGCAYQPLLNAYIGQPPPNINSTTLKNGVFGIAPWNDIATATANPSASPKHQDDKLFNITSFRFYPTSASDKNCTGNVYILNLGGQYLGRKGSGFRMVTSPSSADTWRLSYQSSSWC